MILNKELIEKKQLGDALNYVYPMTFDGEEKYGVIRIVGTSADREIQVYISNEKATLKSEKEEVFQTNDIQKAWEKFEELFNESDEGKTQGGGEEPQVASLFVTFPTSGVSTLFLQNQQGQQQVLMEFQITDSDLILKQPRFYVLDYTDDTNMPEQLRTKWALANTNGDVKLEGTGEDYFTYQVAILSIAPPDGHVEQPTDQMEFYRLIQFVNGVASMEKYIFNQSTKEIAFIGNVAFPATENNGSYDVNFNGMEAKLQPYPSLDEGSKKAYVLTMEGDKPQPSDEMPFFRLVSFVAGILNLKLNTYNKKTKEETFVNDMQLNGEDKNTFYEVTLDGQTMKLVPYPFLDNDTEKAYVLVKEGEDPPPPKPPDDDNPPPPPSDEIQFYRLISDMGSSIVVSQNVFNKVTDEERMIRTLTFDSEQKGSLYSITIEGQQATLAPYPKFDANGQKAYKLIMKGGEDDDDDDDEEDENFMRFYRLVSFSGSVLNFKQYLINLDDNSESFEGNVSFTAEDKGGYFESVIDEKTVRFSRYPEFDSAEGDAYIGVVKKEKTEGEDEGEPTEDDDDDEKKKKKKPSTPDDGGDRTFNAGSSRNELISAIAQETGEDPNAIRGNFRSERFLESYLDSKGVNYSDLGTKLNLPTNRAQLVREIMKIINQK